MSDGEELGSELVAVEFPELEEGLGALKSKGGMAFKAFGTSSSHEIEMAGLDTANPTCKFGALEFTGTYEMSLGSRLFFPVKDQPTTGEGKEEQKKEGSEMEVIPAEGRSVEFVGMGEKKLVFRLSKIGDGKIGDALEDSEPSVPKRGRPRKQQQQQQQQQQAEDEDEDEREKCSIPKRGRPQKEEQAGGGEVEEGDEEKPTKKKKGRPKGSTKAS